MVSPEQTFDPEDPYKDIQGEIFTDTSEVPGRRSVPAQQLLQSHKKFKDELRRPDIRTLVDCLHDQGYVVAAKSHATEIIFDIARHRRAIIAGAATAAGAAGAYHFFRKRKG